MATTVPSTDVLVPSELLDDVTTIARDLHLTRDAAVEAALRRYVSVERWKLIQADVSARVQELGLTEDDIEDLLDSLDDE